MAHREHRAHAPRRVRCAVVTVSDTRTPETDEGGRLLRDGLSGAGHEIVGYAVVPDEPEGVARAVRSMIAEKGAQAVVTTGGTGIAARDTTFEAVERLIEKHLPGFGEIFRALSFRQVGAAAMLSRATAGTVGRALVFALPGSPDAVRLALAELLVPEIGHAVGLLDPAEHPAP